ncbi:MAG TPA: lipoyl(octanoyl) transferase LipB [Candidatus Deferrimicrobiaceae bacterium]|jgi:lipoate-protein ligase B
MESVWLGEVAYRPALEMQLEILGRRADDAVGDTLLLLTHPHVYTLGSTGDSSNLLVPEETLSREGIALERISRGGDITYHGPGQLVGYPIVRLQKPELHRYVRSLESALIEALSGFGIPAERVDGLTGVWVGPKKIASIGVGVRRWVTYHGFALNVTTDLAYFRKINLCGLRGREATSMAELLGKAPPMAEVRAAVADACCRTLGWVE